MIAPYERPAVSPAERCAHCPTDPALRCRGLDVRRYCALLDLAHERHDARYADVVHRESARIALRPSSGPAPIGASAAQAAGDCNCGGVLYQE